MFEIDPWDPLHPRMVGKPTPSLGQNPGAMAYSPKLNQGELLTDNICVHDSWLYVACTLNGGGTSGVGVTCFSVDPVKGLTALGPIRPIPQPGNEALLLGGDILFNPSETALFHTLNNFTAANDPGFLFAYPIIHGQVSRTPIISVFESIADPFSLNFLGGSDSRLFLTNPFVNAAPGEDAPGAVLLEVSYPSLEVTVVKPVIMPHVAACWVAYAPAYDVMFIDDAGLAAISIVNASDATLISQFTFQTVNFGSTDTLVDRNFLYTLTIPFATNNHSMLLASPQVLVWDINPVTKGQSPTQIQSFDLFDEVGTVFEPFGLAIWPAKYPGTGQS